MASRAPEPATHASLLACEGGIPALQFLTDKTAAWNTIPPPPPFRLHVGELPHEAPVIVFGEVDQDSIVGFEAIARELLRIPASAKTCILSNSAQMEGCKIVVCAPLVRHLMRRCLAEKPRDVKAPSVYQLRERDGV